MNNEKYFMTWNEVLERIKYVDKPSNIIYGIPRGGACLTVAFQHAKITWDVTKANLIIDDIVDSGSTRTKYLQLYPHAKFWALVNKLPYQEERCISSWCHINDAKLPYIVFPWETDKDETVEEHITRIYQIVNSGHQFDQDEYDCFELAVKNFIKQIVNPLYEFKEDK